LKPFIPNRAELLSARVRWEDEERVRWEDEERGRESDGEIGRLGEFLFLCSPFFLFPFSFFLLPSDQKMGYKPPPSRGTLGSASLRKVFE